MQNIRNLLVVLGDQLNADASVFEGFDKSQDVVWMAEAAHESEHVWTHKQRIVIFLSAMRHFRNSLEVDGYRVQYRQLADDESSDEISQLLRGDLQALKPERVMVTTPGEWRMLQDLKKSCEEENIQLEVVSDTHFFTTIDDFREHVEGRKTLRMEYFYREQRKRFDILMDEGKPVGGDWNYDRENRESFGRDGPPDANPGPAFKPDEITREVIDLVNNRFADHPGSLESFAWPVTANEASHALRDFIKNRLPYFGKFQDAMWAEEPWLYHSLISSCLNLKLLNPHEVVTSAEKAYRDGKAPLAAVEGFIRQILGWREYVRGIYWMRMPEYLDYNEMGAEEALPDFFWTGKTDLECLKQTIGQTLEYGYAHHIQRLMVTGLYSLLLGVNPRKVHEWYLAVYVDAVEWVELPNTLGMSQYADGGLMASKPYIATGNYIRKMSNYCSKCPRNPKERTGETACPFTTLYWNYLIRHKETLKNNQRMSLQLRNLDRLNSGERSAIARAANLIRKNPVVCYSSKET